MCTRDQAYGLGASLALASAGLSKTANLPFLTRELLSTGIGAGVGAGIGAGTDIGTGRGALVGGLGGAGFGLGPRLLEYVMRRGLADAKKALTESGMPPKVRARLMRIANAQSPEVVDHFGNEAGLGLGALLGGGSFFATRPDKPEYLWS